MVGYPIQDMPGCVGSAERYLLQNPPVILLKEEKRRLSVFWLVSEFDHCYNPFTGKPGKEKRLKN
jgi:hypothetical protein